MNSHQFLTQIEDYRVFALLASVVYLYLLSFMPKTLVLKHTELEYPIITHLLYPLV